MSQKGQTAVEYILMMLVVVTLALGIGKKIRAYIIADGDCPNDSLVCTLIQGLTGPGFLEGSYRYFTIRR